MELIRNEYLVVDYDASRKLVRFSRLAARFPSLEVFHQRAPEILVAVQHIPRESHAVLMDLRGGPMRNDDAFEAATHAFSKEFFRGWRKAAVLVGTAVGVLQMQRQGRETGAQVPVFNDEAAALRHLLD